MEAEIIFQYILKSIEINQFETIKCLIENDAYDGNYPFKDKREDILVLDKERELALDVNLDGYKLPENASDKCIEFIKVQRIRISQLSERRRRCITGLIGLIDFNLLYKINTYDNEMFIDDCNCGIIISQDGNVIILYPKDKQLEDEIL